MNREQIQAMNSDQQKAHARMRHMHLSTVRVNMINTISAARRLSPTIKVQIMSTMFSRTSLSSGHKQFYAANVLVLTQAFDSLLATLSSIQSTRVQQEMHIRHFGEIIADCAIPLHNGMFISGMTSTVQKRKVFAALVQAAVDIGRYPDAEGELHPLASQDPIL